MFVCSPRAATGAPGSDWCPLVVIGRQLLAVTGAGRDWSTVGDHAVRDWSRVGDHVVSIQSGGANENEMATRSRGRRPREVDGFVLTPRLLGLHTNLCALN